MGLSRIATAIGGLLLSRGGRRFAGRHAGKLALATLAWELYQQRKGRPVTPGQTQAQNNTHPNPNPGPNPGAKPHGRQRWSGRRV